MANCGDRVGHVEEHEATYNRVERLVGSPTRHVAFDKRDVRFAGRFDALTRDSEGLGRTVETHDRSVAANELTREASDVAKAGAQVEHAHPRGEAGGLQ
jgi:hypothetical protein